MNWSEVLADPSLQDLPYKIETNEYGQIVMSPASNYHGDLQAAIVSLLRQHMRGGRPMVECTIATPNGVKVPDVAWRSQAFLAKHQHEDPYARAPEICVEVISPSNSRVQLAEKSRLYFALGAKEVWQCDQDGQMTFFDAAGPIAQSQLAPDFPSTVVLD